MATKTKAIILKGQVLLASEKDRDGGAVEVRTRDGERHVLLESDCFGSDVDAMNELAKRNVRDCDPLKRKVILGAISELVAERRTRQFEKFSAKLESLFDFGTFQSWAWFHEWERLNPKTDHPRS